jgi:succinate dehydrogenase / fumarate reductase iron-sulfur subunit
MRHFKDGETIYVEPFRARAFPIIKDLVCNRGALDRIQGSGGYVTAQVGSSPDGNAILISKVDAIAPWKPPPASNAAPASLLARMPQPCSSSGRRSLIYHICHKGQPERERRVLKMVRTMDEEGFGNCSNYFECEAVCPRTSGSVITKLNREFVAAAAKQTIS